MRERIKDSERLKHILDAINVITENKERHSFEEIVNDKIMLFGFVKHVEIIGEAVYKLTKEFREQHSEIEWDIIEGMRHVLVHDYYKIKPDQLWDAVQNDIPKLKPLIENLYMEEAGKNKQYKIIMNNYEQQQYDAIKQWQNEAPGVVSQTIGKVFKPVSWLMEKVVPQNAVESALGGFNGVAQWLCDVEDIKRDAEVATILELRSKSLELSDKLANEVHNWAIGAASAEGAAAGFFGLPGMIADVPALITMGLRVIHKIAVCYGYELKNESDQQMVFGIMSAAGSNTMEEKDAAIFLLRQIDKQMTGDELKKMAANSVIKGIGVDAAIIAIKNLSKQLGINISKRKAFQAIPLVGLAVGGAMNAQFINDIAWAARRTFQERWLYDNGEIVLEC